MILKLYNNNTEERKVREVVKQLTSLHEVVVVPTDTIYALACSLQSSKAIEKLQGIKNSKDISEMSLLCADLTSIARFAKVSDATFTLLRKNLPGGFTFILPSTKKTPEKALMGRTSVGIRIPDNPITLSIIRELGCPLLATSVKRTEEFHENEYLIDPTLIEESHPEVGLVIDGGLGSDVPSTVVDCTGDEPVVVRQGACELRW